MNEINSNKISHQCGLKIKSVNRKLKRAEKNCRIMDCRTLHYRESLHKLHDKEGKTGT